MDYESLTATYWEEQRVRVEALRVKISATPAAAPGRVIPADESLIIGEGKRLPMAVMFLDICGFSRRLSETAAEQDMLQRVLNLFFTEMIRIAEEYGGTVEKNTGDGIMAYFENNAGTPSEGGCKRAVACALTMLRANEILLNPILVATSVEPIAFRVSIDYGVVTIAKLGAPKRFNANVAIGATANFAAKMLAKAGAGEIVLGASARSELPAGWQTRFSELVTLDTGWGYRTNGQSYPLYRYTGRWSRLT